MHTLPVLANGQHEEAGLYSGSFQSVVLSIIVPSELWSETTSNISCVHGDEEVYPKAEVYFTVGCQTYLQPVVLVPRLPHQIILCKDVPTLLDLIQ